MPNLNSLTFLYICPLIFLPIIFVVVWLFPKLLNSPRHIKIIISAGAISLFTFLTITFVDNLSPQFQNIEFITAVVTLFWGVIGLFIGAYYDISLRVQSGAKYFDEVLRFRTKSLKYGIVLIFFSLLLGVISGWLIITFGSSTLGLSMGALIGAIYGGMCGILLDTVPIKT